MGLGEAWYCWYHFDPWPCQHSGTVGSLPSAVLRRKCSVSAVAVDVDDLPASSIFSCAVLESFSGNRTIRVGLTAGRSAEMWFLGPKDQRLAEHACFETGVCTRPVDRKLSLRQCKH
jgi:hypothetical protein